MKKFLFIIGYPIIAILGIFSAFFALWLICAWFGYIGNVFDLFNRKFLDKGLVDLMILGKFYSLCGGLVVLGWKKMFLLIWNHFK